MRKASDSESAPPPTIDEAPTTDSPRSRQTHTYPTVRLDPRDIKPTWPIVIASLEQLAPWSVLALRLGTLALIQSCVRDLAQPTASAEQIVALRALVEALAHMPYEE